MKNKIGWCNLTFNPVWGCRNHCEYCYARKMAKRFAGRTYIRELKYKRKNNIQNVPDDYFFLWDDLKNFRLNFLHSQFNKKFPKKPQRIFVGSMSEIYYWEEEWIEIVIEKVKQYPQHTFMFLTKHMEVYAPWVWPKNCILGVTITKEDDFEKQRGSYYFYNGNNKTFFCFEPLLGFIPTKYLDYSNIDWVILGAESGNRKGRVLPGLDPILAIVRYCQKNKIPIYVKDSLSRYYSFCRGYQQFPTINEL